MGTFGDIAGPFVDSRRLWPAGQRQRVRARSAHGLAVVAAFGLACGVAGCGGNFNSSDLLVDPGRYAMYKCDDLVARWKAVTGREKELRALMARADQTGAGVVVGSLAYHSELDAVVGDERLIQRAAAEKNCTLPFQPQSGPLPSGVPQAGLAPTSQPSSPAGQPQSTDYQGDHGIR